MATFLPKWFLISPCLMASGACSWIIEASSERRKQGSKHIHQLVATLTFDTHIGGFLVEVIECRQER